MLRVISRRYHRENGKRGIVVQWYHSDLASSFERTVIIFNDFMTDRDYCQRQKRYSPSYSRDRKIRTKFRSSRDSISALPITQYSVGLQTIELVSPISRMRFRRNRGLLIISDRSRRTFCMEEATVTALSSRMWKRTVVVPTSSAATYLFVMINMPPTVALRPGEFENFAQPRLAYAHTQVGRQVGTYDLPGRSIDRDSEAS